MNVTTLVPVIQRRVCALTLRRVMAHPVRMTALPVRQTPVSPEAALTQVTPAQDPLLSVRAVAQRVSNVIRTPIVVVVLRSVTPAPTPACLVSQATTTGRPARTVPVPAPTLLVVGEHVPPTPAPRHRSPQARPAAIRQTQPVMALIPATALEPVSQTSPRVVPTVVVAISVTLQPVTVLEPVTREPQ